MQMEKNVLPKFKTPPSPSNPVNVILKMCKNPHVVKAKKHQILLLNSFKSRETPNLPNRKGKFISLMRIIES